MSEGDHVRHDTVVRQLVNSFELLLEGEGTANEPLLLLVNLDFDVLIDACVQFWLHNLDLLVGPVSLPLPVRQMQFVLFLFRWLVLRAPTFATPTL